MGRDEHQTQSCAFRCLSYGEVKHENARISWHAQCHVQAVAVTVRRRFEGGAVGPTPLLPRRRPRERRNLRRYASGMLDYREKYLDKNPPVPELFEAKVSARIDSVDRVIPCEAKHVRLCRVARIGCWIRGGQRVGLCPSAHVRVVVSLAEEIQAAGHFESAVEAETVGGGAGPGPPPVSWSQVVVVVVAVENRRLSTVFSRACAGVRARARPSGSPAA